MFLKKIKNLIVFVCIMMILFNQTFALEFYYGISYPSNVSNNPKWPNRLLHCRSQMNTSMSRSGFQANTLFNEMVLTHLFPDNVIVGSQSIDTNRYRYSTTDVSWRALPGLNIPGYSAYTHTLNFQKTVSSVGATGNYHMSSIRFTNTSSNFLSGFSNRLYFNPSDSSRTSQASSINPNISAILNGIRDYNGSNSGYQEWAMVPLLALPCITDTHSGSMNITNIAHGAYRVQTNQIGYTVRDDYQNDTYHYPFSGLANGQITKGVFRYKVPTTTIHSTFSVDEDGTIIPNLALTSENYYFDNSTTNQRGINSGTINMKVTIHRPNASTIIYDFNSGSFSDGLINPDPARITGTWQALPRDYFGTGTLPGTMQFGNNESNTIEAHIEIEAEAKDNSPYHTNKVTKKIEFNTPRPPYVYRNNMKGRDSGISGTPINQDRGPLPGRMPNTPDNNNVSPDLTQIKFQVEDDWSGVNSGSLVVRIFSGSNPTPIYQYVYGDTGMVLQPVELTFVSNGLAGSNAITHNKNYFITLTGFPPLAEQTTYRIQVSGTDMAGNQFTGNGFPGQTNQFSFTTRKSCKALQCSQGVTIYTGNRDESATDALQYMLTGLTVTGGTLPFLSGQILYCNNTNVVSGYNIYTGGFFDEEGYSTGGLPENLLYADFTGSIMDIECQGCSTRLSGNTLIVENMIEYQLKVSPQRRINGDKTLSGMISIYENVTYDSSNGKLNGGTLLYTGLVRTNSAGIATFQLPSNISGNNYYVTFQGLSHLRHHKKGVNISPDNTMIDMTTGARRVARGYVNGDVVAYSLVYSGSPGVSLSGLEIKGSGFSLNASMVNEGSLIYIDVNGFSGYNGGKAESNSYGGSGSFVIQKGTIPSNGTGILYVELEIKNLFVTGFSLENIEFIFPSGVEVLSSGYSIIHQLIAGKMKYQRAGDGYNGIPFNRTTVYSLSESNADFDECIAASDQSRTQNLYRLGGFMPQDMNIGNSFFREESDYTFDGYINGGDYIEVGTMNIGMGNGCADSQKRIYDASDINK